MFIPIFVNSSLQPITLTCDDCDWKAKPISALRQARALRMHRYWRHNGPDEKGTPPAWSRENPGQQLPDYLP